MVYLRFGGVRHDYIDSDWGKIAHAPTNGNRPPWFWKVKIASSPEAIYLKNVNYPSGQCLG